MPEFIPLSLILQAHTIPAIKKPQRKPGHFTYSCLYKVVELHFCRVLDSFAVDVYLSLLDLQCIAG